MVAVGPSLGLDSTYPFPLECITLQTPAGSAGKSDIAITSLAGSVTSPKAFQYLQSENFYAKPSFDKFVVYDQPRQWLYLSDIDHIDVFDLSGPFSAASLEPPGGPPPSGQIRGLALTPDGTQLVVADFGAQSIYLLDPVSGSGTTLAVGGVPGYASSGPARVAATSTQNVFVGLSAESGTAGACTSCLGQLNLSASPPTLEPATPGRSYQHYGRASRPIERRWQSGFRCVCRGPWWAARALECRHSQSVFNSRSKRLRLGSQRVR